MSKGAGSAGQKRKSAGLHHNGPRRKTSAPQPAYAPSSPRAYAPSSPRAYVPCSPRAYAPSSLRAYAPSSPRAYAPSGPRPYAPSSPRPYAPSSPRALPAEMTESGDGHSAGNLAAGPGSQGSAGAAPGAVPGAQASSAISTSQSLLCSMHSVTHEADVLQHRPLCQTRTQKLQAFCWLEQVVKVQACAPDNHAFHSSPHTFHSYALLTSCCPDGQY